ncbi:MAG: Na(+)-translocating NADH-quinone reductase subunit C [Kistimonas sp.]|nr:Na(+)-translocating NADH-quinone reductase subunit C [Kistimonas sp.]
MASNETTRKTLLVSLVLSLVCSVLVSASAVYLGPRQQENKVLDVQRNILAISGLVEHPEFMDREFVQEKFQAITPRLVDIRTGHYDTSGNDPVRYDQRTAARDPARSRSLPPAADAAKIRRQAHLAQIYEVREQGELKTLILPIHGYGLWSTLYGYIALESDLTEVAGLGFYEHGETPGLGGEVDNPRWKELWEGKRVFNDQGRVDISVIKGAVDANSPRALHQVDGLSGATLTSRGVNNLVQFWLGDEGFGPFLANLKEGKA